MVNDLALIGAPADLTGSNPRSAYVFRRNGSSWERKAKFSRNDGDTSFGSAVAVVGNTALVGKLSDSFSNLSSAGAVFVYDLSPY